MKSLQKLFLSVLILFVIVAIYYSYFAPTTKLGDFSKFGGSEINQRVNVLIVKESEFGRTESGEIISFRAEDKNNVVVNVALREPVTEEILDAEIVELLGHIHGDKFSAVGVKIIK